MSVLCCRRYRYDIANALARNSPWRAISVVAKGEACAAAVALKGVRKLSTEALTLPLPKCSKPESCNFVFRKYEDHRVASRRDEDESGFHRHAQPPHRPARESGTA